MPPLSPAEPMGGSDTVPLVDTNDARAVSR